MKTYAMQLIFTASLLEPKTNEAARLENNGVMSGGLFLTPKMTEFGPPSSLEIIRLFGII